MLSSAEYELEPLQGVAPLVETCYAVNNSIGHEGCLYISQLPWNLWTELARGCSALTQESFKLESRAA